MLPKTLLLVYVALVFSSLTLAQTSNATARKFDEFGDIQASDLIARLDNLAIQVQNEPGSKAFLIVYRTRRDLRGLSNRYAHRMRSYLINMRGLPSDRIITVDGGVAPCLWQEIWVVPPGTAPKPRADAYDSSYQPSAYKFDQHEYQIGRIDPDLVSYWPIAPENLIGYLESFGEALLKDRKLIGYIVAFRDGARDNRNSPRRILQIERNFLIREFRINPSRIKIIDGGFSGERYVELWIAEPGFRPVVTSQRVVRFREN